MTNVKFFSLIFFSECLKNSLNVSHPCLI